MKSALRSAQGMEQLRHRLMNISPEGQRCSVDQNTLKRTDLDDFVNCYFGGKRGDTAPRLQGNRHDRKETERFKSFTYEDLIKRDKINLDILTPSFPTQSASRSSRLILRSQRIQVWLKDESLEDSANLPDPGVIALEITEDLEAALAQFAEIAADLKR